MDDDGFETQSSRVQRETEEMVAEVLARQSFLPPSRFLALTQEYLLNGLCLHLGPGFAAMDASKPWLCYWMIHGLNLLGGTIPLDVQQKVIYLLQTCQNQLTGGFGGGLAQLSHTAPTFGSVMALVSLRCRPALQVILRGKLYRYFLSLKLPNGSFQVHADGESDSRAMYTVLAVASLTNILTPELASNCVEWIATTQGFDGGIGGEPGNESHGGYAYCGLASLVILRSFAPLSSRAEHAVDLDALSRWLAFRQMPAEGGFQGRTNKLVDSCYSFWQGASFRLINMLGRSFPSCNAEKLTEYVFGTCFHENGGLKDKADTNKDYYHTCYSLSGVSVVNHQQAGLEATDPVFNVVVGKLGLAKAYFAKLPSSHEELMRLE